MLAFKALFWYCITESAKTHPGRGPRDPGRKDSMSSSVEEGTRTAPWVRPRHRAVTRTALALLDPIVRRKYGVEAEPFERFRNEPCLILYNHQTPCDQFFVAMSFRRPIYYLTTEDIFSKGWISVLLRWAVAPIPFTKQTTDVSALASMMKVAHEGGTIAIAPEGNRTYSGKTEYMSPAITFLVKRLRLPVVLYRIEGGYGVQPRWSNGIRKGRIRAYASRVIEPEEVAKMTNAQLFQVIQDGLYVNEAVADARFISDTKAEYLERMAYICPFCGLSRFESQGDEIRCLTCGKRVRYGEDKRLTGLDGDWPFAFVNDWYEYQKDYINHLDVRALCETPVYEDRADVYEVISYKRKELLDQGQTLRLYGDRITLKGQAGGRVIPFAQIQGMALIGRNRLNIAWEGKTCQLRGDDRFNALKYMHFYHRFLNMSKGEPYGEFLGL